MRITRGVLHYLFARYKWYRRLVGGKWYFVFPRDYVYLELWVQDPIEEFEIVMETEEY